MTIPTRPAPPPPNRSHTNHHNATSSSSTTLSVNRISSKKPAPPRPPPPKVTLEAPLKKSSSQKSISIFSNIFGAKSNNKQTVTAPTITANTTTAVFPIKLPAPPKAHHQIQPRIQSDVQLINFDASPPSSPPSIKKSNTGSDSVSMDSFCSSTSSPNNLGATSQAESGFEDDFSVSDFKVTSGMTTRSTTFSDPFDCIDDFSPLPPAAPSNIRNVKPLIQPKPTGLPSVPSLGAFDTLSNGKNLIKPSPVSMPTIIKPMGSGKGKVSPINLEIKKTENVLMQQSSDESFDDDLPSPPMPTIPPPPPPPSFEENDEEKSSHAIALFDFESDVPEDLNIKANEKIYLIKQMNDEWMFGRNKRGCEGIFPMSFVEVRVPLKVDPDSGTASRSASVSPAVESHRIRALYNFNAETDEDLTIQENEVVNVIYEINPEWLYGSNERGDYGQFPSNFIEFVPHNLPQMPK